MAVAGSGAIYTQSETETSLSPCSTKSFIKYGDSTSSLSLLTAATRLKQFIPTVDTETSKSKCQEVTAEAVVWGQSRLATFVRIHFPLDTDISVATHDTAMG